MFAVMHNEPCEDSWRSAGFRVIENTSYLASCAQNRHRCRNEKPPDPPLLVIPQEPDVPVHLDPATENIRHLVVGPYNRDQAKILGMTEVDIRTSRYRLHTSCFCTLSAFQQTLPV